MTEAIQALKVIINSIIPFLPYITIIPAVLFLFAITFKITNKEKLGRKKC